MSDESIARAQLRSQRARAQLSDALLALKERLLPRTIARNLVQATKEKAVDAAHSGADAVKARPGLALGAAALAALFVARKPIARAFADDPETDDEQETSPDPARSRSRPRKGNR